MSKKISLKNSTILLIGIILSVSGVVFGISEYLVQKKEKAFSDMNILLYKSETPEQIDKKSSDNAKKSKTENETSNAKENVEQEKTGKTVNNYRNSRYSYIGFIEIPKIHLKRGFLNLESKYNNVDYNVTVIRGANMPDVENGNLILAAHSGDCNYCYFDDLYKLSKEDVAYVTYNNKKYKYKIVNIYEVDKTGTVAIYRDYSKKVLTLITCTRNSKTKQTVYILENY